MCFIEFTRLEELSHLHIEGLLQPEHLLQMLPSLGQLETLILEDCNLKPYLSVSLSILCKKLKNFQIVQKNITFGPSYSGIVFPLVTSLSLRATKRKTGNRSKAAKQSQVIKVFADNFPQLTELEADVKVHFLGETKKLRFVRLRHPSCEIFCFFERTLLFASQISLIIMAEELGEEDGSLCLRTETQAYFLSDAQARARITGLSLVRFVNDVDLGNLPSLLYLLIDYFCFEHLPILAKCKTLQTVQINWISPFDVYDLLWLDRNCERRANGKRLNVILPNFMRIVKRDFPLVDASGSPTIFKNIRLLPYFKEDICLPAHS